MKCIYCNQDCTKIPNALYNSVKQSDEYTCDNHKYQINYQKTNYLDLITATYRTSLGDKLVIVDLCLQPTANQMSFRLWVSDSLVLELKTVPTTITPDNIDQKLPTLITFS